MTGTPGHSGGANRRPTALKLVMGTARPGRMHHGEPMPPPGSPRPPPWLPDGAKAHYQRVAKLARRLGVLSAVDAEAVALAAVAIAEYITANELVERGGLLIWADTRAGRVLRRNPACALRSDAWRRARDSLRSLGLDPQSRSAVSVLTEPPERDPAERYFHS